MKRLVVTVILTMLLGIPNWISAQEAYQVIGHPDTTPDTISRHELRSIFFKRVKSWPTGHSAEPVDLEVEHVRAEFCKTVMKKSLRLVTAHWQGQIFAGKGPAPRTFGSDTEVIVYVSSTPGAVGYVSKGANTRNVKIITVTE